MLAALDAAELDYWCARRLTLDAWLVFLDDVREGAYRVEAPTVADLMRCRDLQARYRDLELGVVDASVIALSERLGESKVATLDRRRFRTVQPSYVPAPRLLPE